MVDYGFAGRKMEQQWYEFSLFSDVRGTCSATLGLSDAIASSDIKCGWINKHSHPLALSTTLTYILLPPKIIRHFIPTLAWFLLVLEIYSVLSLFNINHLRVFFKHQERIGKATSLLCSRPSPPAPNLLSRASNFAEPNAMQDNYQS